MIIYIHGFASSAYSNKAQILKKEFSEHSHNIIAPSLSHIPTLAIETLKELIEAFSIYEEVYLIGSSLGGYYALYLSHLYNIPAVLINPALQPEFTLKKYIPSTTNYYDGSEFEYRQSHIESLQKYRVEESSTSNIFLMLQKGDEVIDYTIALKKLNGVKTVVEEGGDHSFRGVERYTQDIEEFFSY